MAKVKEQLWHEPEIDYELQVERNMNISELSNSKFIKKEEVEPAVLVTIQNIKQENVAKDNEKEEFKYVVYFKEMDKPLVLNQTNGILIARVFGSEESDDWIGKQIVLFNDPTIMFAGEVKGGIRIRAPKPSAQKAASTVTQASTDDFADEDIGF